MDGKHREGTDGPSPAIERSKIAQQNELKSGPSLGETMKEQTEGSTEQHRRTEYIFTSALLDSLSK